jgi:hypothetical protein
MSDVVRTVRIIEDHMCIDRELPRACRHDTEGCIPRAVIIADNSYAARGVNVRGGRKVQYLYLGVNTLLPQSQSAGLHLLKTRA